MGTVADQVCCITPDDIIKKETINDTASNINMSRRSFCVSNSISLPISEMKMYHPYNSVRIKSLSNLPISNQTVIRKQNGNPLSRTSDKKYEALLKNGVAPKGSYTKANVKTAVDRFMKALDGTPEKLQTAKNLVTMFNGCSDWNETLQKAANVAQRYVNEHKDEA